MPFWTTLFLAVAALAGLFGFGGIPTASAVIAQVICVIFLGLGLGTLLLRARSFRMPSSRSGTRIQNRRD